MPGRLSILFLNIDGQLKLSIQLVKVYNIKHKGLLDTQEKMQISW